MEEDLVLFTPIPRWNHKGLPVDDEPRVTKEPGIENAVDGLAVVVTTVGNSFDAVPFGFLKIHSSLLSAV